MPPRSARPCSPSPPPGCVRGCRRRRDQPNYAERGPAQRPRDLPHACPVGRCPPPAARSSPGAASLRPRAAAGSARRAPGAASRRPAREPDRARRPARPARGAARAREQRRSLWPVAGRAPAHRPGSSRSSPWRCAGLRRRRRRLPDRVGRHHRRPLGQLAGPPHPRVTAARQPGAQPRRLAQRPPRHPDRHRVRVRRTRHHRLPRPTTRLQAGRLWQRLYLTVTAAGTSLQPLCQIPQRIDREQSAGRPADIGITMAALLPTGQHPLMTFRIGHPTATALRSPRRPADHVLLP